MKLEWSETATECLVTIGHYLKENHGESSATAFLKKVYATVGNLRDFPLSGRTLPDMGDSLLRELVAPPWRVIYELDALNAPSGILIVGVVHSAQLLENTPLWDMLNS